MSQYSTIEQQASYGIGRQIGDQVKSNPFDGLDANAVAAGVLDSINGAELAVSGEKLQEAFEVLNKRLSEQKAEQAKEATAAGTAFLEKNAQREEVTVTESGLQYEVLQTGEGEKPSASNTVKTHYHGTLIDGKVFDSSYDRGEPVEFPVGGVIAGWTEALQLMTVGSKWRLTIPYNLAYGEQGAGGAIGPYETLVFDVELLDIVA